MDATDSMLSIGQTVILGRQQVGQALLRCLVVPERRIDQMLAELLDALAHVRSAAVRGELQSSTDAPKQAQIVIGSSFGGAVLAALIQRGDWPGPALFLAQAALRRGLDTRLPTQAPVWIVHGTRDTVVSVEDSRRLAAANPGGNFRLIEVDDDHSLHTSVDSGALIGWVTSLGDLATD